LLTRPPSRWPGQRSVLRRRRAAQQADEAGCRSVPAGRREWEWAGAPAGASGSGRARRPATTMWC